MTGRLTRISRGTSAEMVARMLAVCFPDARTVLDATWGRGRFWTAGAPVHVIGLDLSPHGGPHVVGDFTRLPFRDGAVDVVVFDPPYLTESGRDSVIRRRFTAYPTIPILQTAVMAGAAEAYRVARIGVIAKVMDYCHASRLVRMTRWVEDAMPVDLFDVVHLESAAKIEDPKWRRRASGQLSVRANATTWLAFRHEGPIHKRRKAAS